MEYNDVITAVKQGKLAPLYIIEETDEYLLQQFYQAIETVMTRDNEAFERFTFDLEEQSLQEVLAEATEVSFFADKKMLLIQHPQFLWTTAKKMEASLEKAWLDYIAQPNPDTVLLLLSGDHKRDRRRKLVKATEKTGVVLEAQSFTEKELMQVVLKMANQQGKTIEPSAAQQLVTMTNGHLSAIHNELTKIVVYMGDDTVITQEMVTTLVAPTLEHHLFEISDNLLNRHLDEGLRLYHELLLQGEDTIKMNFLMMMQFRLYLQVAILQEQHYRPKEMASLLNIHPYRVELALKQVRHHSVEEFGAIYNQFVDAEYAMKTSALPQEMIFELLLIHLQ